MYLRDMERSDWTRILSKQQIIRDFARGGRRGKVSLLKILALTEPLTRFYEGREVVLADVGYCWVQLAVDRAHAWFTAMYDDRGRFLQLYVDVTDGNDARKENPTFVDMYLDFVLTADRLYELDRDELDGAFAAGAISKAQYETALTEGQRIYDDLSAHAGEVRAFFDAQYEALLEALDQPGS